MNVKNISATNNTLNVDRKLIKLRLEEILNQFQCRTKETEKMKHFKKQLRLYAIVLTKRMKCEKKLTEKLNNKSERNLINQWLEYLSLEYTLLNKILKQKNCFDIIDFYTLHKEIEAKVTPNQIKVLVYI